MFFGGSLSKKYYGVMYVRSASVYLAIIAQNAAEDTHVVLAEKEISLQVNGEGTQSFITAFKRVKKDIESFLLREGVERIKGSAKQRRIEQMIVTFAAPWSRVISRTVSYENEILFEVTNTMLLELSENAEEKIEQELKNGSESKKLGFAIGERTVVHRTVNGYPVTHLLGQHGNSVELTHVHNLIVKDIADAAEEMLTSILPHAAISMYAHLFMFYKVICRQYSNTHSFCFVDINNFVTEIAVINNGIIQYVTHVPFGTSATTNAIGSALNTPKGDAKSKTRAFNEGVLNTKTHSSIDSSLQKSSSVLKKAIHTLYENYYIPQTIFISAEGEGDRLIEHVTAMFAEEGNETHKIVELSTEFNTGAIFARFLREGPQSELEFVTR